MNNNINLNTLLETVQLSDDLVVFEDDGTPVMVVMEYETVQVMSKYIEGLEDAVETLSTELRVARGKN